MWWSKRLAATATPVTVSFAPAVVANSEVVAVIRTLSRIVIEPASATPAQTQDTELWAGAVVMHDSNERSLSSCTREP